MDVKGSIEEAVGKWKVGNGGIVQHEHRMIRVEVVGNIVEICVMMGISLVRFILKCWGP